MFRCAVVVMILLGSLIGAAWGYEDTPARDLVSNSLAMEKNWDVFVRGLFGCPQAVLTDVTTCSAARQHIDYAAFRASCESAKKLFRLEGQCQR